MGADNGRVLATQLRSCDQLTHLDLGKNDLGDNGITAISSMLGFCSRIRSLDLRANFCSPTGATHLAENLSQCVQLEWLCLKFNYIQDAGGEEICSVLHNCSGLTHLNLAENELSFTSFDTRPNFLTRTVPGFRNLRELILSNNSPGEIWEDNLTPITHALAGCPSLQRLEFAGLELEGLDWLLPSLRKFTALTHLDLSDNLFEDEESLKLAISQVPSLKRVRL
mmetsp:Transcript_46048/g.94203  ORF Transcript_46048/g.94203 Transcript_46048/m.94203 type:complete len:224 (+) Transcript_46048:2-673(+)